MIRVKDFPSWYFCCSLEIFKKELNDKKSSAEIDKYWMEQNFEKLFSILFPLAQSSGDYFIFDLKKYEHTLTWYLDLHQIIWEECDESGKTIEEKEIEEKWNRTIKETNKKIKELNEKMKQERIDTLKKCRIDICCEAAQAYINCSVSRFFRDEYEVLGVSKDASKEEIVQAYRRKILIFHPDRNSDKKELLTFCEEETKMLNEAYETLIKNGGCNV